MVCAGSPFLATLGLAFLIRARAVSVEGLNLHGARLAHGKSGLRGSSSTALSVERTKLHGAFPAHRMTFNGHRGSSHKAPENTLESIHLAFAQNADGVEFDVGLSKDGEVFLNHLEEKQKGIYYLSRSSEHCPPKLCEEQHMTQEEYKNKLQKPISELSYENFIRFVDVGSWKNGRYANETPPTLRQAMAKIPDDKYALCELKGDDLALGEKVVNMIVKEGWSPNKLSIIGFSLKLMADVKQRLLKHELAHLVYFLEGAKDSSEARDAVKNALFHGLDGVDLKATPKAVTAPVVEFAHGAGMRVGVWITKDLDTIENAGLMEGRGVDFFSSDFVPKIADLTPKLKGTLRCKEGDRIVGRYLANGKWYSGEIKKVRSRMFADVRPDDNNENDNWKNLVPSQVLKSSDDGSVKKWAWRHESVADVPETHETSLCTEFELPEVKCGQGDRIVGRWGGNDKWYSGVIMTVRSSTSVDILPDDSIQSAGWDNVGLGRVLKSSDEGDDKKWCWRQDDITSVATKFETAMCTEFILQPPLDKVTCKSGDRIVGQWGGNGLWYSGRISRVHSSTTCDIMADDFREWKFVRLARVLRSSDDNLVSKWVWRARNVASIIGQDTLSYCAEFVVEADDVAASGMTGDVAMMFQTPATQCMA